MERVLHRCLVTSCTYGEHVIMKILIGYDGSECSDLAISDLRKAGLPEQSDALVLTVGEAWDLPLALDGSSADSGRFVHPTTRRIKVHLTEVSERSSVIADAAAKKVREMFPEWQVTAAGSCGKPGVELIKKADAWSPDLLVVGSHGRSAVGRLFLGSVSQKALYEARCSLRIARENRYGGNPNTRILIGVDSSANADAVVKTVASRKWPADTEIRLVAVNDPFPGHTSVYILWDLEENKPIDNQKSREWLAKVIDARVDILESAGLQVSHNIRFGDAGNMILHEAEDWKPDTIFVGARGLGRVKRFLLGSVSSAVAAKAKCSVEVVR